MRALSKFVLTLAVPCLCFAGVINAQLVETGRLYLPDSRYQQHLVDSSGNIFVATDSICIKYDTSFAQQWATGIPNFSSYYPWIQGFTQDNQGDLLILKEEESNSPTWKYSARLRVTKIGPDGTVHWNTRYDSPPGYDEFSTYSRGPFNFWTDQNNNIYVFSQLNAKVAGNCWSDSYLSMDAMRSWLFSLAPSGSLRWSVAKSVAVENQLNAMPVGYTTGGSCYMWNAIIHDDCWGSNANTNCLWQDSCTPTQTYSLSRYNANGTEEWEQFSEQGYYSITVGAVSPSGNFYEYNRNNNILYKKTAAGSTVWSVTVPEEYIHSVKVSDDEEHVLVRSLTYIATGPDQGYYRIKDQCYNRNGSLRWENDGVLPHYLPSGVPNNLFDLDSARFYALTGRDSLTCINLHTGERLWTQLIGNASMLATDTLGRFYIFGNDGPPDVRRFVKRFELAGGFTVLDANRDALTYQELYLIRVTGDAPNHAEDTLGVVKTDADGKITLTPAN